MFSQLLRNFQNSIRLPSAIACRAGAFAMQGRLCASLSSLMKRSRFGMCDFKRAGAYAAGDEEPRLRARKPELGLTAKRIERFGNWRTTKKPPRRSNVCAEGGLSKKSLRDCQGPRPLTFNREQQPVRCERKALRRKAFFTRSAGRAKGASATCNPRSRGRCHLIDRPRPPPPPKI